MASNVGDIQVADLLSQRVGVDTEQVGGADLVSACRRKRRGEQRELDLPQDSVIEAGRRDAVVEAGSVSSSRGGGRLRLGPRTRESRD
jgi:hypothetical protein